MNPLVSITATLYFEVKNAAVFGGEGSVGYTSTAFSDVVHPENLTDEFINNQREITAKMLSVSTDDVTLISKETYEAATEGPDNGENGEDWENGL